MINVLSKRLIFIQILGFEKILAMEVFRICVPSGVFINITA